MIEELDFIQMLAVFAVGVQLGVLKKHDGLNSVISFIIGAGVAGYFGWKVIEYYLEDKYRDKIDHLEVMIDALEAVKIG